MSVNINNAEIISTKEDIPNHSKIIIPRITSRSTNSRSLQTPDELEWRKNRRFTIGIDFGTLSGRLVLADVKTGVEYYSCTYEYPHAVMDEYLIDKWADDPEKQILCKLPPDYALQNPDDYMRVIQNTVTRMYMQAGDVEPTNIVGVGIDFTACTMLPVLKDGTPLCYLDEFKSNPHAYVKLWKHHAAQKYANQLNQVAHERNEPWIKYYGGSISSEWMIPKIMQVLEEAPEVYEKTAYFIEATDWVVWQLCGKQVRNSCTAGYKAMFRKEAGGYPSKEFFKALNPKLENIVKEKLDCEILPIGTKAGDVCTKMHEFSGLPAGIAVAVGNVDAHVAAPALKISGARKMFAIMGTSTCHMLLDKKFAEVPGICGSVEDGILPGYVGHEAGQSCVGDHFAWFINNCVPASYNEEADKEGISVMSLMIKKASKLKPGESGILALDWWNGNRSTLVDVDLSGLFIGMNLQTKPEEMFRALIEATAFGTKQIIDNFTSHGVSVDEFIAAGGIAEKDPFTMQIYADIINMKIRISGTPQAPALGSAIFAAVAAGSNSGGYDSIEEASKKMGKLSRRSYRPIPENAVTYEKIYSEYKQLYKYFSKGVNDMMKRLKVIKAEIKK